MEHAHQPANVNTFSYYFSVVFSKKFSAAGAGEKNSEPLLALFA